MGFFDGPTIVTSGLVLSLDAADKNSYPGSGTNWNDLSGNNYSGSLTNGPTFNNANGGNINFNVSGSYIDLGNIFNFTSEPFSFSYWIYPNSLTTSGSNAAGQGPIVLFKGAYQTNGFYDQIGTTGYIAFITNQSGANQGTNTANVISIQQWYNICYTRSGASVRIFLNGNDVTNFAATHVNPASSANNFRFANYNNGQIYGNFRLASFLTYNRALSSTEVLQNHNAQKSRFGL